MTVALVLALAASFVMTRILISLSPQLGLVDYPNERSLHTAPVATIGGVSIQVGMLAGLGTMHFDTSVTFLCSIAGAALLLLILIFDEWKQLSWVQKLAIQVAASALVCWIASLDLLAGPALGLVLAIALIVFLQNIYNFMDGMDGLSGLVGVVASWFLYVIHRDTSPELAMVCTVLSVSCVGFVIWNLPPARIFMGDVGSHFLGLVFGWVALTGQSFGVPVYVSLMPIGAFLFDACYTIVLRAWRRENLTQAHRFHLYQRMNLTGWSSIKVDAIYVAWSIAFGMSGIALARGQWMVESLALTGVSTMIVTVVAETRWRRMGVA